MGSSHDWVPLIDHVISGRLPCRSTHLGTKGHWVILEATAPNHGDPEEGLLSLVCPGPSQHQHQKPRPPSENPGLLTGGACTEILATSGWAAAQSADPKPADVIITLLVSSNASDESTSPASHHGRPLMYLEIILFLPSVFCRLNNHSPTGCGLMP